MSEETTLWTLEADPEGAIGAIDETVASLDDMAASITSAAESASALDALPEALAAAAESASPLDAAISALTDGLTALVEQVNAAAGSISGLGSSADATSGQLDAMSGSADAAAGSLDSVAASATAASAAQDAAKGSSEGLASGFRSLRMPLLLASAAVVALGVVAVHMAGDFQESMTQLVTGAGESQANLKTVSDGVLAMAGQVGESTSQLSQGLYMIESAGFHGSQALTILRDAAEGAKVGAADLGTTADAVTTILADYGKKGETAAEATNALIATVASGKTHMQDLAGAMSQILPTAAAAGVSLNGVMAAMATMTGEGVPAAQAATYLRQTLIGLEAPSTAAKKALASVGLSSDQVAAMMKQNLPEALKMITDAVGKKFPKGSAEYVNALKNIAGGSRTMQGLLDLTGDHLSTFEKNLKGVTGAVKSGGNSIQGWSQVQQDFNQKMAQAGATVQVAMIHIGAAIMPVVGAIAAHLMPAVQRFSSWASTHGPKIVTIVGLIAAAIGGALVAAVGAAVAALSPAILIAGAITAGAAALGVAIALLVTHWKQVTAAIHPFTAAIGTVLSFLTPVWQTIQAQVGPVLRQLGLVLKENLLPAWHSIQGALSAAKPLLVTLAAIIGGGLVVNIGIFIGMMQGMIAGLSQVLQGAIRFGAGLIQAVAGAFQVVTSVVGGAFNILRDIATGQWSKIGQDARNAWNGIVAGVKNIVGGLWHAIQGLFQAGVNSVLAFIGGFVGGVIGFFKHLFDTIVGHSIIPDLVNGIVSWIAGLPGKVLGIIGGLVGSFLGKLGQLKDQALSWAGNLVSGIMGEVGSLPGKFASLASNIASSFIGQLKNLAGNIASGVGNAFSGAVNAAKNLFHIGSPSKVFADIGTNVSLGFIQGVKAVDVATPLKQHYTQAIAATHAAVKASMAAMTASLAGGLGGGGGGLAAPGGSLMPALPASGGLGGGSGSGGDPMMRQLMGEMVSLMRQQQAGHAPSLGAGVVPATLGAVTQQFGSVNFHGIQNIGDLYAILNTLAGYAVENGLRGATAGMAV